MAQNKAGWKWRKSQKTRSGFGARNRTKQGGNIAVSTWFWKTGEQKHKTHQLQLIELVWSSELLCIYCLGIKFQVLNDHKARVIALGDNWGNKIERSILIKWVAKTTKCYHLINRLLVLKALN